MLNLTAQDPNSFLHFEKQGSVLIGSESPVIRFTHPIEKIGFVFAATGFS